jgi:hypothetical protein
LVDDGAEEHNGVVDAGYGGGVAAERFSEGRFDDPAPPPGCEPPDHGVLLCW